MDNRVTKSEDLSVKVQRVDSSYTNFILIVLRCILTDFERNNQAKICSNQVAPLMVINSRPHDYYTRTNNILNFSLSLTPLRYVVRANKYTHHFFFIELYYASDK